MKYIVYKLTSPSGGSYIGRTGCGLKERWRNHVRVAMTKQYNTPLYNAIRKYGAESFVTEELQKYETYEGSVAGEIAHIKAIGLENLYNLSPGGEADFKTGRERFWTGVKTDPEAMAKYLAKLSAIKKADDWTDYAYLAERAAKWRGDNPKEAWKNSYRASRVARRLITVMPTPPERSLKERLMWKHNRSGAVRKQTLRLWARRTPEEIADLSEKIRISSERNWKAITDPKERSAKTAVARASIDRSIQGPAASRGLKKYWEELRKDPEKFRRVMKARVAGRRKAA